MSKVYSIIFAALLIIGSNLYPSPTTHAEQKCDEVQFLFARGSGEVLDGPSYQAWRSSIENALYGLDLQYSFFELGSDPNSEHQYPAVAVAGSWAGIGNLIGAYISAGSAFEFGASVIEGVGELSEYLSNYSAVCSQTKYVLGGYSQGAMVNTKALPKLDASKIIYVANFGDPKTYLPEGQGRIPDACLGKNLSSYRAYVSDCHAYKGILGAENPYQPANYIGKLGLWCNEHDIMCSSGISLDDHTSYVSRGLYQNAAEVIAMKVRAAFLKLPTTDPSTIASTHDLIILFDVSGSMQGSASLYRDRAQALAYEVRSLGGRVALFTYKYPGGDNIKMACDFSCDASEFTAALAKSTELLESDNSINQEPLLSALDFAMRSVEWQVGATKSIVALTNGAMEDLGYDRTPLENVIKLSLSIDPVNVYALVQYPPLKQEYAELTERTNGKSYYLFEESELAISEITGRPIAKLGMETYSGLINQEFFFDASESVTIGNSNIVRYDWDLDCDGRFELQDTGSSILYSYNQPMDGYIQVKITDEDGRSSTMSAQLTVFDSLPELAQTEITHVEFLGDGLYRIDYQTDGCAVLVTLNDAVMGFEEPDHRSFIRVKDVTSTTSLTLTAYSKSGERGLSATVILGPDGNSKIEQPDLGDNMDSTDNNIPSVDPDSSIQSPTSPDQSYNPDESTSPSQSPPASRLPSSNQYTGQNTNFIPKAPNAGYYPLLSTEARVSLHKLCALLKIHVENELNSIHDVNLGANDHRTRNGTQLKTVLRNHAVPLTPPPLLPRESRNKLSVVRPPNIS